MYNVISKLSKGDSFVCFRESKLTRILQPYLGGNSLTAIICTVSPSRSNFQETANTLRFGMCAGGIKNDVKVNLKEQDPQVHAAHLAALLSQTREAEQQLITTVNEQRQAIEANETEYERQTREVEAVYEAYLEALQIKADLVRLKTAKRQALETGRQQANEARDRMAALAKRLQEIRDCTDVANLERYRQEIEDKSRAMKAATQEMTRQQRDLEASISFYNREIDDKNKSLTALQQKTSFLNRSVAAFENVLKERSAGKVKRRGENDRLIEVAKKEAEIVELTVRLEMAKRDVAEKEEAERWNKIKLLEYQYKLNLEYPDGEEDGLDSEDASNKGSMADTLTYEGIERKSVKSMSVISESELMAEQSHKHMSMYDGPKQPLKFAKPTLVQSQGVCPLDESNMSEFELELYNCAKSSRFPSKDGKISNDSTTMIGKRSVLQSVTSNNAVGKKSNYVDLL